MDFKHSTCALVDRRPLETVGGTWRVASACTLDLGLNLALAGAFLAIIFRIALLARLCLQALHFFAQPQGEHPDPHQQPLQGRPGEPPDPWSWAATARGVQRRDHPAPEGRGPGLGPGPAAWAEPALRKYPEILALTQLNDSRLPASAQGKAVQRHGPTVYGCPLKL